MTETKIRNRQKWKQYSPIIFLMAGMLTLMTAVLLKGMDKPPIELLYIQDRISGTQIEPYYEEAEDTYYFYLPSYATKKTIRVSLRAPAIVSIADAGGGYPLWAKNYRCTSG